LAEISIEKIIHQTEPRMERSAAGHGAVIDVTN